MVILQNETRRKKQNLQIVVLTIMIGMLMLECILLGISYWNFYKNYPYAAISSAFDLSGMIIENIIFTSCVMDTFVREKHSKIFQILLFLNYAGFFLDFFASFLERRMNLVSLNFVVCDGIFLSNIFFYYVLIFYFKEILLLKDAEFKKIKKAAQWLLLLQIGYLLLNHRTKWIFNFDEQGMYIESPTYYTTIFYYVIYWLLFSRMIYKSKAEKRFKGTLIAAVLLPAIIHFTNYLTINIGGLITFGFMVSLILMYSHVYIIRGKNVIEKEKELTESKLRAMMLQINPHFIYNTLGSIQALYDINPKEAQHLLKNFSLYLRNNYRDMSREPMIPFYVEMENLRQYLEIERVRFPNIQMEFDIQVSNFLLPCLLVQPLVENAIKHGISKRRKSKGTLKIQSYETKDGYHIRIEDDGVGFDDTKKDWQGVHVGIENSRKRLKMLCGGTLKVHSVLGEGTVSEIEIPKEET